MYRREERYDRLPSPYISLEESCHRVRLLHIFEDLEEDDLLLIGE
jgi:predicted methyltransferase